MSWLEERVSKLEITVKKMETMMNTETSTENKDNEMTLANALLGLKNSNATMEDL